MVAAKENLNCLIVNRAPDSASRAENRRQARLRGLLCSRAPLLLVSLTASRAGRWSAFVICASSAAATTCQSTRVGGCLCVCASESLRVCVCVRVRVCVVGL
jgi:hypothetical protein